MTPEIIGVALALLSAGPPWRALPDISGWRAAVFRPAERAVDNWRREAVFGLDLTPEDTLALALGREIRGVSRCVRLNNYWCVKKAGWTGEIASDAEGHVAFASAREGAAVAAQLLRRYYVDFGLHSARAIVQRWAPAQCGLIYVAAPRPRIAGAARTMAAAPRAMGGRSLLGPEPKGLSTRGLGSTLRARWLASHGRAGVARAAPRRGVRAAAIRRSVVPDRVGALMKTPTIDAGFSALEMKPVRLAMAPFPGLAMGPAPTGSAALTPGIGATLPPLPVTSCASETARIANYSTHIAEGVAAGPDADLALFDAEGRPSPNLARALFNMAAVEIGPLRARQNLVDAALAVLPAKPAKAAPK